MNINPAYSFINDKQPAFIPEINGKPIEKLASAALYKYLGHYINLENNNTEQHRISSDQFKTAASSICNKHYLGAKLKVLLINTVAQAMIVYHMNTLLFNINWL